MYASSGNDESDEALFLMALLHKNKQYTLQNANLEFLYIYIYTYPLKIIVCIYINIYPLEITNRMKRLSSDGAPAKNTKCKIQT